MRGALREALLRRDLTGDLLLIDGAGAAGAAAARAAAVLLLVVIVLAAASIISIAIGKGRAATPLWSIRQRKKRAEEGAMMGEKEKKK